MVIVEATGENLGADSSSVRVDLQGMSVMERKIAEN